MAFHIQSNKMFSVLFPNHSSFQVTCELWCVLFITFFFNIETYTLQKKEQRTVEAGKVRQLLCSYLNLQPSFS